MHTFGCHLPEALLLSSGPIMFLMSPDFSPSRLRICLFDPIIGLYNNEFDSFSDAMRRGTLKPGRISAAKNLAQHNMFYIFSPEI